MCPVREVSQRVAQIRAYLEFVVSDARVGGLVLLSERRRCGWREEVIDDDDEVLHFRSIDVDLRRDGWRDLVLVADFKRRDLLRFQIAVGRKDDKREGWNEGVLVIR